MLCAIQQQWENETGQNNLLETARPELSKSFFSERMPGLQSTKIAAGEYSAGMCLMGSLKKVIFQDVHDRFSCVVDHTVDFPVCLNTIPEKRDPHIAKYHRNPPLLNQYIIRIHYI